jgi:hypothetical protein
MMLKALRVSDRSGIGGMSDSISDRLEFKMPLIRKSILDKCAPGFHLSSSEDGLHTNARLRHRSRPRSSDSPAQRPNQRLTTTATTAAATTTTTVHSGPAFLALQLSLADDRLHTPTPRGPQRNQYRPESLLYYELWVPAREDDSPGRLG